MGLFGGAFDRVQVSTAWTPAVSIPVNGSDADRKTSAIGSILRPTVRAYPVGGSDPIVLAPWGESSGSWSGVVALASVAISLVALGYAIRSYVK